MGDHVREQQREEHADIGDVKGKKVFVFDDSGNQITSFGGDLSTSSGVTVYQGSTPWNSLGTSSLGAAIPAGEAYVGLATVDIGSGNTVDTELPAAVALSDALDNPTAPAVGSYNVFWDSANWKRAVGGLGDGAGATGMQNILPMMYNGSTHDRLRGTTANGLDVDVTRMSALVAGEAYIGLATVDIGSVGGSIDGPGEPSIDSYTQLAINLNAAANQVLVSSAVNKQIWVYAVTYTCSVAGTVSFQDEDDTAITGIMDHAANSGLAIGASGNFAMPLWKLATNKDLEVDVVTAAIDGFITYALVSV